MRSLTLLAALGVAAVQAQIAGFNYGALLSNGQPMLQADFEAAFKRAQSLPGTEGRFTSARLFTTIQAGTADTPSFAIPAAINTQTHLLLGIWASAGSEVVQNEIFALTAAAAQYGTAFTNLIDGISVGSEDLYRNSPMAGDSLPGAQPGQIARYINHVRDAIRSTELLQNKKIGHVDTWTAWINGSNSAVVDAVDWLGVDAYPYFQNAMSNSIDTANSTFFDAYDATVGSAKGKEVWITETGWPVSGKTENLAVASTQNAQKFWQDTACSLLGRKNVWWYLLWGSPINGDPDFAILPPDNVQREPRYSLDCPNAPRPIPSSSSSYTGSATAPTAPGSTAITTTLTNDVPIPSQPSTAITTTVPDDNSPPAISTTFGNGGTTSSGSSAISTTISSGSPASSSVPAASGCPTNLNGEVQYPHLIIPVNASNPDNAPGTQYYGTINPEVSTIYNFDIPGSYAGKTCSVVFLFSTPSYPYTFNNKGGLSLTKLDTYATQQTNYANKPGGRWAGGVEPFKEGGKYVLATGPCEGGKTIAYQLDSTNGLDLYHFEGGNPTPLGLFISTC